MREPPFFAVTPPLNRRYIAVTPIQMREPPLFAVFNVDVTQMEMQRTLYVYVTPADAAFEPPGPSRAELTDHPNFAGIGAIFFEPGLLAGEICEAGFGGVELFGKRGHAVAVSAGIIAPVGKLVTRFGERGGGFGLRLLRFGDAGLCFGHGSIRAFGRGA